MAFDILYSFVGNHDPLTLPDPDSDSGPVISLLRYRRFDHLVLFVTAPEYNERAIVVQQAFRRIAAEKGSTDNPHCSFVDIRLASVVDYEEIFARLTETIPVVESNLPYTTDQIARFVLLDPGTPAMQTVWFLMVRSGVFDATLLQGIPARFAGGTYRARPVDPSPAGLPGEKKKTPGTRPTREPGEQDWMVQSPPILGESPEISLLMHRIEVVSHYDETVLISGETGTGKELVARHIHTLSHRAGKPYIPVNCAALSAGTIDSELFGHTKGSFTGAVAERNGVFRSADEGTLFLDEVGELPLPTQAKLLRAIEYGEVTPVGADRPVRVNVRLLAATNRDLHRMVDEGAFRADLLARLRQLDIIVPPLRNRGNDARILTNAFIDNWCSTHTQKREVTPGALEMLDGYTWPGNVRELQNLITRVCTFSETGIIDVDDVKMHLASPGSWNPVQPETSSGTSVRLKDDPIDLQAILRETERKWYEYAYRNARGNKAEAARLLGIQPPAFRKALKERFPDIIE